MGALAAIIRPRGSAADPRIRDQSIGERRHRGDLRRPLPHHHPKHLADAQRDLGRDVAARDRTAGLDTRLKSARSHPYWFWRAPGRWRGGTHNRDLSGLVATPVRYGFRWRSRPRNAAS
jgi:hypothetical protein